MSLREFRAARETPGHIYELIDGALVVSPVPTPKHDYWVQIISEALRHYSRRKGSRVRYVTERSEVDIPDRAGPTRPQPDVAAYARAAGPSDEDWSAFQPLVVAEVISERRGVKDTVRNRNLYWRCRGIREYWIVDTSRDGLRPELAVLVRRPRAKGWEQHVIPFGRAYRCKSLPGLMIDLSRPQMD